MIKQGSTVLPLCPPSVKAEMERHYPEGTRLHWVGNPHYENSREGYILRPNYSSLPAPEINHLVIPTGATRWAYSLVLANDTQKDAICSAGGQIFEFGHTARSWVRDGGGTSYQNDTAAGTANSCDPVRIQMYPLSPQPVSPLTAVSRLYKDASGGATTGIERLWLIPLVDARYFWQFTYIREATADGSYGDANALLDGVIADMAPWSIIRDDAHGDYYRLPDITSFANENAAEVLESLCWQLGLACVPDMNAMNGGTEQFYLMGVSGNHANGTGFGGGFGAGFGGGDPAPTFTAYELNKKGCRTAAPVLPTGTQTDIGIPSVVLGGESCQDALDLPETINVWTGDGDTFLPYSHPITNSRQPGTTLFLRPWFVDGVDGTIAARMAEDFGNRWAHRFHWVLGGVQYWQPTAYDDFVQFEQTINAEGTARALTTVRSLQPNVYPNASEPATGGGGLFAWGTSKNVDCANGRLDVLVTHVSECPPNGWPDYTPATKMISPVWDLEAEGGWPLFPGHTEAELTDKRCRIEYVHEIDGCDGRWVLLDIYTEDGCI